MPKDTRARGSGLPLKEGDRLMHRSSVSASLGCNGASSTMALNGVLRSGSGRDCLEELRLRLSSEREF